MTRSRIESTICHLFLRRRHSIAVSRTLHSSNHNAFTVKKYRKWSFWKL